ncbi:MAG: MtnX-like HAD-IB family phosphatase [bacterium]
MVKVAVISDFDGTISKEDFFYYVIDNHLSPEDIEPWNDYKAGKINHVEGLRRIFSKISMSEKDLKDFILKLPIEENFLETLKFCNDNNIDFYVLSAGADYYIKIIFNELKVSNNLTLISNPSIYAKKGGISILPSDTDNIYYSHDYGVSKKLAVEDIKQKYDKIIFAGDGIPDFEASKLADVVFARGALLQLCNSNNVKSQTFNTYGDILEFLKNDKA